MNKYKIMYYVIELIIRVLLTVGIYTIITVVSNRPMGMNELVVCLASGLVIGISFIIYDIRKGR